MNNVFNIDTLNNKNIPQELIDECEELFSKDGLPRFIFDKLTSNIIKRTNKSVEENRDIVIDSILNSEQFYISDFSEFDLLPSRFSYYDTETKLTCRYKRYNLVIDFFSKLNFEPGLANLGPEFEQSFVLRIDESNNYNTNIILRLKPNLCLDLIVKDYNIDRVFTYSGFFNRVDIIDFLSRVTPSVYNSILRNLKLENILN